MSTPANVHELAVAGSLLHGDESVVHGDSGYRGIARWCDTPGVAWMVAVPLPRNRQRQEGAGGASTDDALSDRGEAGCQISL